MKKSLGFALVLSAAMTSRAIAGDNPTTGPAAGQPAGTPGAVSIFDFNIGGGPGGGPVVLPPGGNGLVRFYATVSAPAMENVSWLGVGAVHAEPILLKQLKLKTGLVVTAVEPGSPAEKAGLKTDDLITKVDDQILINPEQLRGLIRLHASGESLTLTVVREGQEMKLTAKLAEHQAVAEGPGESQDLATAIQGLPLPVNGDLPGRFAVKVFADGGHPELTDGQKRMVFVKLTGGAPGQLTLNTDSIYRDHGHAFITSILDGKKQLLVIDDSQKQLFFGPVDTTDAVAKIPADLQDGYKGMVEMEARVEAQTPKPAK